jgi:hypothetical protein
MFSKTSEQGKGKWLILQEKPLFFWRLTLLLPIV